MIIRTAPGAARVIAEQAPYALTPENPERWTASAPPDPNTLRQTIEGGVRTSLLAIAGAVLIVASLSIANSMVVSVLERTRELGIRRALGATGGHVRLQILTEAALIRAVGGVAGVSVAVIALVAVSSVLDWTASMPPWIVPAAPVLGIALGVLGGLLPAQRASRISPIEAMRGG